MAASRAGDATLDVSMNRRREMEDTRDPTSSAEFAPLLPVPDATTVPVLELPVKVPVLSLPAVLTPVTCPLLAVLS